MRCPCQGAGGEAAAPNVLTMKVYVLLPESEVKNRKILGKAGAGGGWTTGGPRRMREISPWCGFAAGSIEACDRVFVGSIPGAMPQATVTKAVGPHMSAAGQLRKSEQNDTALTDAIGHPPLCLPRIPGQRLARS